MPSAMPPALSVKGRPPPIILNLGQAADAEDGSSGPSVRANKRMKAGSDSAFSFMPIGIKCLTCGHKDDEEDPI